MSTLITPVLVNVVQTLPLYAQEEADFDKVLGEAKEITELIGVSKSNDGEKVY